MADNYLERRMEDYRAGRLASQHRHPVSARCRREGELVEKYPRLRVLVTGDANGIGEAVVKAFRGIDAKVDLIGSDAGRGNAVAQKYGARFYRADVSNSRQLESCIACVLADRGDIDVVVNNLGEAEWCDGDAVSVSFDPVCICVRCIELHRKNLSEPNSYGGRIINVLTAINRPCAGIEEYVVYKDALASITRGLVMQMASYGITVNSVSCRRIGTDDEALFASASGRVVVPDDVARIVRFMALPQNDFINGADICVDGGVLS